MLDSSDEILSIKQFSKEIQIHLREDYDCVIAITGIFEGIGKSSLGVKLGKGIDPHFSITKNILYSPTQKAMKDLIFGLPKYSVVDADEAIKILYKLKWADKMTIYMNQLYALCRQENLATILPMPRIQDFVEFFRNHKIKFWLFVIERGVAAVFFKDWNPFAPDPWYMKENFKIIQKYRLNKKTIFYSRDEKIAALKRCTNFVGILEFPDLTEEEKFEYKENKRQFSYADIDAESNTVDTVKIYEAVDEILRNPEKIIKEFRGKRIADLDKIMTKKRVGRSVAMQIKKEIEERMEKAVKEVVKGA